jgi:ketosteroid isomerase-like protein
MMSKEKAIVTAFITAAAELRVDDAIQLIADDCECWYTGGGLVSREDFVAGMRFLLGQVAEPGPVLIKEMIQEGNRVAVEYANKLKLRNGRLYDNAYQSKMVIENRKITVLREYLDSAHVAQVFGSFAPAKA